jgi:hypothetical protein
MTSQLSLVPSLPKILPWVECNKLAHVPQVVAGLKVWQWLTKVAIVSTVPGQSGFYRSIRRQVPGISIIPGIKTHSLLEDDFASRSGWKAIRDEVVQCLVRTKSRIVIFDHESAMRPVWTGDQLVAYDCLRDAIQLANFPRNVTYLWYPSIGAWRNSREDPQQDAAAGICKTVQDAFPGEVIFVDHATLSGPTALEWPANIRVAAMLDEFSLHEPIPVLYCYGPGSRWWEDEDLPFALSKVEGNSAILYPGLRRWSEAARSILRTLLPAGYPLRQ